MNSLTNYKIKKCPKCKMDIDKKATICPHCRSKQGSSGCAVIVVVLLVLAVLGVFRNKNSENNPAVSSNVSTSATTTPESSDTEGTEKKLPTLNGFVIGERSGTNYDGYCEVIGVVGNGTGKDLSYVEITIGFYNKNGVKITSGIDNVLNLGAGETWQYDVLGFGDGISTYKIEDITYF